MYITSELYCICCRYDCL